MASSSSSSHSIPASSSQSWNHDVFLSFRGEDTRKTFVDHLYTALVQQGIHTYKDDETLPRGESIGPSLLKAIRESRIAVIVFSENYADSSWCLDELTYIMKCKDTRGQIVMPIFYNVDPSEVRKQKGRYGESFVKHEMESNNKVESWRKALANAGNLSGWVPKDIENGHEAKCIKVIVDTISSRLFPLILNVNNNLIGMETRLHDLKSLLEIGSGGVRMVGIWGVGGGGKTTLASFAYAEISRHFEARYFLENIREESSKHGLKILQERVLSQILKIQVVVESEEGGRCMMRTRLCNKNILLILDDVDDLDQLEALAGSHDWFGVGSRIIITTRDKHLLTRTADSIYGVSLLSHDEASELFRRHAYREYKPVEDYEMLSQHVVSYAKGLPLALKILGSFLYDKDKDEWISALVKLRDISNQRIMDTLTISYDGLQPDEKELFLDIACFFKGKKTNEAIPVLDVCGFHPVIGLKVLVQKSLISVSNGVFDMHDLVEEMAHYIVRGEHPNHPDKHSRVWQQKDVLDLCAMNATMENYKIEVLALAESVTHPRLPHVVANLKKLRWIQLTRYPASSLPTNFQPTELRCLMLTGGLQKQLWQGCKHLPNLKMLDLRGSMNLIRTPDFNGLPCLERMVLKDCRHLKEIHPSIGYHKRLVFIDLKRCLRLKMFPPIIQMEKLETLKLSRCEQLEKFPDIQSNMDSLVKLRLNCTAIKIVPASVGQFCTNLVYLDMTDCEKLESIKGNFRLLKDLKELHVEGCKKLDKLADNFFDVECCLEVLCLSIKNQFEISCELLSLILYVWWFQFIPPFVFSFRFPQFPRFLRSLNLSYCYLEDATIPPDICELYNLQVLDLSGNFLVRFYFSLSRLSCLKFLNLSSCKDLEKLPELPSSIAILEANDCDSLESVGDLSNCKWLWKVSLWRENKLSGSGKLLQSMLQGNAVEDHFMSVILAGGQSETDDSDRVYKDRTFTLQLPHSWYNDFSGFILCLDKLPNDFWIVIEQEEMCMDSQPDHWEEFDKNPEADAYAMVGYVSFSSLRHTLRRNSTCTSMSFHTEGKANLKVGLVPRKCKGGDSRERAYGTSDSAEYWDEHNKTVAITEALEYCVIIWGHQYVMSDCQFKKKSIIPRLLLHGIKEREENL